MIARTILVTLLIVSTVVVLAVSRHYANEHNVVCSPSYGEPNCNTYR